MSPSVKFPQERLTTVADREPPITGASSFTLALNDVESWTGELHLKSPSDELQQGNLFTPGTILFGKLRPYLAKIWVSDRTGVYIGDFISVRPRSETDPNFLSYVFRTEDFIHRATAESYGSKMPRIEWDRFKNLKVPIPPYSTQRKIVDFLDHETAEIDAFIADQERLIELLEERRAATITHAVTKGLDPNAPMKDSGINWLGNVPEDWVVAPLKWISKLVTGTTPSTTVESHFTEDDDGFPWIRPEDIDESGQSTVASKKLSSTGRQIVRSLPPGTVLLVCIGATLGKVGITSYESSTNQQITAIYGKGIDCKYLFYTMQVAYPEVRLSATGTTLPILNSSRLGSIRVPLPSEKEQRIISTYLERETSAIDAAVCDAREAIALSKERRAALISAAVTGQLDVSQAHSRGAAAEMLEDEVRV